MAEETKHEEWKITVLNGKETIELVIPPPQQAPTWLTQLQDALAARSGIAVAHQKLLFRGKQLALSHAAELKKGTKLMLLKNATYHKANAAKPAAQTRGNERDAATVPAPAAPPAPVSQRLDIDVADIADDHVFLQASRGKSVCEFLFDTSATIETVKARVGGAMGLAGAAIRLLLKGKTPADANTLASIVGANSRVVKCMVLLQPGQYDRLEKEDEFLRIQNDLTSLKTQVAKLSRVMQRNVLPREEVLLQLHVLQDNVAHVLANLEIVEDHLQANKLVEKHSATLKALENAQREGHALKTQVETLTHHFENGK